MADESMADESMADESMAKESKAGESLAVTVHEEILKIKGIGSRYKQAVFR